MTDGGLGAVEAVLERLDGRTPADLGVGIVGACVVQTVFADAAAVLTWRPRPVGVRLAA